MLNPVAPMPVSGERRPPMRLRRSTVPAHGPNAAHLIRIRATPFETLPVCDPSTAGPPTVTARLADAARPSLSVTIAVNVPSRPPSVERGVNWHVNGAAVIVHTDRPLNA